MYKLTVARSFRSQVVDKLTNGTGMKNTVYALNGGVVVQNVDLERAGKIIDGMVLQCKVERM